MEGLKLVQALSLLGCFLFLASCDTSSSARCYTLQMETQDSNFDVCNYLLGITYKNSNWTYNGCENCSCDQNGVKCCTTLAIPTQYDEENCHPIFHQENCTYTVVDNEDPEKPCAVGNWIL
ncbi:beta-microseminoprotein-like [Octodon degus]|uniref:Beta-microseminoprotein n=1 Tax=Octodon degus TaxID=10160 RepID=A0A6P6DTK1_OCTDE|nr:beta-microseminoprotein-like [Octodon degus]